MKRSLSKDKQHVTFEHEHLDLDEDSDTEDGELTKNNNLIDMNKVHEYMSKNLLSDRLTRGFVLFGTRTSTSTLPGSIFSSTPATGPRKPPTPNSATGRASGPKSTSSTSTNDFDPVKQNEITRMEIAEDIADNMRVLNPINATELATCIFLYQNTPVIRDSNYHFKTHLFKKPFKVSIVSGYQASEETAANAFDMMEDDVMAVVNEELEELIVQNKWTPMLEEHYKWQKMCGVVPIYFDPVGIKHANGIVKIHYVPKIPLMESGTLFTYLDKRNRQNFVWQWNGNNNMIDTVDGFDMGYGGYSGTGMIHDLPEVHRELYIKKSRYMFFDVPEREHAPTLNGDLQSDFKSIISEWKNITYMRNQMIIASHKAMHPELIVEFNPDLNKVGSSAQVELLRVWLEAEKIKEKNLPFGGLESYSTTFGETLESSRTDGSAMFNKITDLALNSNPEQTRYSVISQERNTTLSHGASQYVENELGLDVSSMQRLPATSASQSALEKLKLDALNNPGGVINQAFKQKNSRSSYPTNAKRLDAFEKATHAPVVAVPKYNIYDLWARFDNLVSSICDFPPELLKTTGVGGAAGVGQKPETSTAVLSRMDIFKERIKKKGKSYEVLIRQLWVMGYAPFKRNTRRDMKIDKMLPNIDPSVLKMFDQVRITLPVMPFMDYNFAKQLYKDGFLPIEQLYDFVEDNCGIQKRKMTAKDYKKIENVLNDRFNREDGLVAPEEAPSKKKKE